MYLASLWTIMIQQYLDYLYFSPFNVVMHCNIFIFINQVCQHLGILEYDYFGLQFSGSKGEKIWLNMRNRINQQVSEMRAHRFHLRVKFYIQPHLLLQESSRQVVNLAIHFGPPLCMSMIILLTGPLGFMVKRQSFHRHAFYKVFLQKCISNLSTVFGLKATLQPFAYNFHLCDNSYMYTYMNCTCQSSYLLCTSKQVKVFSCICPISAQSVCISSGCLFDGEQVKFPKKIIRHSPVEILIIPLKFFHVSHWLFLLVYGVLKLSICHPNLAMLVKLWSSDFKFLSLSNS